MNVIQLLMRRACLVSPILLLVGQALSVSAQTVLVDFGSDTSFRGLSQHGADSSGNYWNSLQPGLIAPGLVDIANVATPTQIAWDTPVASDSYNGPAGPTSPAPPGFPHYYDFLPLTDIDAAALGNMGGSLSAAFDFAASPGPGSKDINGVVTDNKTRFQIQGLDPTKTYDLSFFGSHKYSDDTQTVYSVYSESTYTSQLGTATLNVQDPSDPSAHNRDTIATISGLVPASNTILYVQFIGSNAGLGYLNELRIQATGVAPGIPGDYNSDGKVDARDYAVWRKYAGTTHALPNDPTGGTIGGTQYTTWRSHFGTGGPGAGSGLGSGGAVPEPACILLAFVGAFGLILRRWR